MATITPAILAASSELYQQQVDKVADFAERLHVDILMVGLPPARPSTLASYGGLMAQRQRSMLWCAAPKNIWRD